MSPAADGLDIPRKPMKTIDATAPIRDPAWVDDAQGYSYRYSKGHTYAKGWGLFTSDKRGLEIQRIDGPNATFSDDAAAALHVVTMAAIDPGPEGRACRRALRLLMERGTEGEAAGQGPAVMMADTARQPLEKSESFAEGGARAVRRAAAASTAVFGAKGGAHEAASPRNLRRGR
ncbi:MAG: hypothetical protein ACM31O_03860 [Bacteroidota bacterium]